MSSLRDRMAAPRSVAPALRELQRAMRNSIVLHENDAPAATIIGDRLAAEQRLAIYRNTFVGSLTRALRLTYPAVDRLVGRAFFDGVAQAFMRERPPHSAWLDAYGADFPEFLGSFAPSGSLSYLADVARLEWAVSRALHAPDAAPVELARLAGIDEADHGRIRFTSHPSVSLLRVNAPVDELWRAVIEQDDAVLATLDLATGPICLIVERSNDAAGDVRITRIEERAWRFALQLFAGVPLAIALEAAADSDAPAWLAEHLSAGRFVAFDVVDASEIPQPRENLR